LSDAFIVVEISAAVIFGEELVNLLVGGGGELLSVIIKKLVWFNGFF